MYFGAYFIPMEKKRGLLTCRPENRVFDTTNGLLVLKGRKHIADLSYDLTLNCVV